MTKNFLLPLSLWFILLTASLDLIGQPANLYCEDECPAEEASCEQGFHFPLPNKISLGPEIYYLTRARAGGTKQTGWMSGIRGSYDRIKRYRLYWGFEALYAKGSLKGHNGIDDALKSSFTDAHIEGRFGYTFQAKCNYLPAFTPFVGYGYFRDINKFKAPSPLTLKFITSYKYVAYGFLSSVTLFDDFTAGFNFKGWSMINARTKVQDDPQEDDISMLMGERFNYRLEMPILYRHFTCSQHLEIGLIPFYECRHYGSRENFPFDYFDTKFRLWGASIQLTYRL